MPMAFFVTIWAKPIVYLLYGARFDPSVAALQILIWSAALMWLTIFLGSTLVAAEPAKAGPENNFLGISFST